LWEQLQDGSLTGKVLATFDRACVLLTPDDAIAALVLPHVGDGPLNIVVNGTPGCFDAVELGRPAYLSAGTLNVGEFEISLSESEVWEPCPNWDKLRSNHEAIVNRLSLLQNLALRDFPDGSLLALSRSRWTAHPTDKPHGANRQRSHRSNASRAEIVLDRVFEATTGLRAGWDGEISQLRTGAASLSGLGSGLTPAGDDFLIGLMLWAWLAHPTPARFCQLVFEAAAPWTTTLSAAFLRAAAGGEYSASWHCLLAALEGHEPAALVAAVRGVLAQGSTSGADALAGFLWMGLHPPDSELLRGQASKTERYSLLRR
jgi:hypothetical protein